MEHLPELLLPMSQKSNTHLPFFGELIFLNFLDFFFIEFFPTTMAKPTIL